MGGMSDNRVFGKTMCLARLCRPGQRSLTGLSHGDERAGSAVGDSKTVFQLKVSLRFPERCNGKLGDSLGAKNVPWFPRSAYRETEGRFSSEKWVLVSQSTETGSWGTVFLPKVFLNFREQSAGASGAVIRPALSGFRERAQSVQ